MDSLRIYTSDRATGYKYMVGFNFLKRFNVFFDLKNQQIGLLPIKFERVVNPGWRVFHYFSPLTPQGTGKITVMGDYKKNYFKTAGLQVGDEIVRVNDSLYKNIMNDYALNTRLLSSDTLYFDILRKGQPMRIAVPVDKNEVQGD
jgi:S1-C subfamily serine protease